MAALAVGGVVAADVIQFDVGKQNTPLATLAPWHGYVWAPASSNSVNDGKASKVMMLASGFAGFMASTDYSTVLSSVAENTNTVVVGIDRKFKLAPGLTVNYTNLAFTTAKFWII